VKVPPGKGLSQVSRYAPGLHLSSLLRSPIAPKSAEPVGRLDDVIVRLRGGDYPVVTGLVAKVGGRRVFVPIEAVDDLQEGRVELSRAKVDLRAFERRDGEVLLREDILGHRAIDVPNVELVRAWDIELRRSDEGWVASCLDTRRPARLFGLIRRSGGHPCRDWKAVEPLVGHRPSALLRAPFGRLRRLKPAQIADLLEDASRQEGHEILEVVHRDPELEADVFEELEPDTANRYFEDKTNDEVAAVIARMRNDDAADAISDLPQARRKPVLDLLPAGVRAKVTSLLGYNPTSAGGMMGLEFLSAPPNATVEEALRRLRLAESLQPEALLTVFVVNEDERLLGEVSIIELVQADLGAQLDDLMDRDPVRVNPETDVVDVSILMADFNLLNVAVVDDERRMIGVITVDDVLEATIPNDWRRREPPRHPEEAPSGPESAPATAPASPR
jgi:CBS domain-containing protein